MQGNSKYQGRGTLEILEGARNYNRWIADAFRSHLESPVLEIGSGLGTISKFFLDTVPITLSDKDEGFVKFLTEKFSKRKGVSVREIDIERSLSHLSSKKYSTVIAINVLEHIEDDILALQNMFSGIKKGGRLLILVPAKKFAFSRLDTSLGHYRRYEKEELEYKLTEAGFVVKRIYYFNIVGLLSWMIREKIERNHSELSSKHVWLFDMIVPMLKRMERFIRVPVGISLVCVAEKTYE